MPMGTIVTVCMLIGLIFSVPYAMKPTLKRLPHALHLLIGSVVFAAGAWNTFWHGLRNLTNFWGVAALISGIFMMLTALYIIQVRSLAPGLNKTKYLYLAGLLVSFILYAVTIARL